VALYVKNNGKISGKEIAQLYVLDIQSTIYRPDKELKDFTKIELEPGEVKSIRFELNHHAFSFYNTDLQDWHVEPGAFEILVGASSQDIRLKASVEVISSQVSAPAVDLEGFALYYNFPKGTPVS
jgi:beta-glucosidase